MRAFTLHHKKSLPMHLRPCKPLLLRPHVHYDILLWLLFGFVVLLLLPIYLVARCYKLVRWLLP